MLASARDQAVHRLLAVSRNRDVVPLLLEESGREPLIDDVVLGEQNSKAGASGWHRVARLETLADRLGGRGRQGGDNGLEQFGALQWLEQVGLDAEGAAPRGVPSLAGGGQHHDRRPRGSAMARRRSANMKPSIPGMRASSRMSWNDPAGAAAMAASASAPLATAVGRIAQSPQRALEDAAIGVVVVDDQHPHALERGRRPGRRRRRDDAKVRVESKHAAASHLALDRDDAAHPRDELCADGEAEARAAVQPCARAVGLGEGLEDPRVRLRGNPDPGIGGREPKVDVVAGSRSTRPPARPPRPAE